MLRALRSLWKRNARPDDAGDVVAWTGTLVDRANTKMAEAQRRGAVQVALLENAPARVVIPRATMALFEERAARLRRETAALRADCGHVGPFQQQAERLDQATDSLRAKRPSPGGAGGPPPAPPKRWWRRREDPIANAEAQLQALRDLVKELTEDRDALEDSARLWHVHAEAAVLGGDDATARLALDNERERARAGAMLRHHVQVSTAVLAEMERALEAVKSAAPGGGGAETR